jgi:hypothetical protein
MLFVRRFLMRLAMLGRRFAKWLTSWVRTSTSQVTSAVTLTTRRLRTRYRLARRFSRRTKRRIQFRAALFLYRRREQGLAFFYSTLAWMGGLVATLAALVLAILFAASLPESFLHKQEFKISEVHLACAGIIGTALALVLTLSIVPAQKAADVFSSAILKLYARDHQLHVVFWSLSLLALVSLLLGTNWTFHISPRYTLAAQIVGLGAALDALRAFYTRALDLLVPSTALALVDKECQRYIRTLQQQVSRLRRIYRLTNENLDDATAGWLLYSQTQVSRYLTGWTLQLEEFAHKALARKDTQAVDIVLKTIASIGIRYAESRRDSFVLQPDLSGPLPIAVSDIGDVLNPINEHIKNICQRAVKESNEAAVISCLRTLGDITVKSMTMVQTGGIHRGTAPLAYAPIFYIDQCAKQAIPAAMDDALLTAITAIGRFFASITPELRVQEAESTALDCLANIATTSYGRQATIPCFRAVEMMLRATHSELSRRGYDTPSMLQAILPKIASLVPFEAAMDALGQRTLQTFPPYSLGFQASIPQLLAVLANKVAPPDPERRWIDPFHDFVEASEDIVHHYRDVAKKTNLAPVLLLKWVVDSVMDTADVHLHLIMHPPAGAEPFLDGVENRLIWFIHTPSPFFKDTTAFPARHAEDTAGRLAILGMRLLQLQRFESAKACAEAIAALGHRCTAATNTNAYDLADILIKIEMMKRAASALGHTALVQEFQSLAMPVSASGQPVPGYQEALDNRTGHLQEALDRYGREFALPHDPLPILRRILAQHPPRTATTSS